MLPPWSLCVAALAILPQVRFDYNLLNMQDQKGKRYRLFKELLADAEQFTLACGCAGRQPKETERLAQRLAELPEVSKVVTIFDLLPAEQEEKLLLIEEMALTVGPITNFNAGPADGRGSPISQRKSLDALAAALDRFIAERPDHPASASVRALKSSLAALLARLDAASADERSHLLQSVEDDLLTTLPSALQSMRIATEAVPFGDARSAGIAKQPLEKPLGRIPGGIYPAEDLNDNDALRRFVRAVQQVAPNATGAPMVSLEAGEAVVQAFIQAFLLALAGIVVALLILLRSVKYTLLVLTPLLLSSLFTAAFTVLLNVPFNFANIIALPLLLVSVSTAACTWCTEA